MKKSPKQAQNFELLQQQQKKKPWQSVWSQALTVSWLRKSCPPPKLTLVFFSQRKWLRYTMCVNLCFCFLFFGFWDLTVVIGVIAVCSWTQGKWLQWDLEHVIELEIWYLWVWRRVTMFFCLSLGVPKSSLVKKSMFLYLLCSVLVSLKLFRICIYIFFGVLVCGFCCAGSFCTGMRISWALFMTDWFLAFNGILFGFRRNFGFIECNWLLIRDWRFGLSYWC